MFERVFGLAAHGTSVRTEVMAGCTTFLTMAYITFVNPLILSEAGMDFGGVFVATCLAAAIGTSIMALAANYPVALAPGMGLNAYFTYGVVLGMGHPWQTALGAVFLSGVLFLILSLLPVREWLINAIPRTLKLAISAGIGLFLATQSPGDFDYRCRDQVRLWLIGRVKEPVAIGKLKPMLESKADPATKLAGQGAGFDQAFDVLCQSPIAPEPCESALDQPAFGQELETFGIARTLDDLQPEPFLRSGASGHIALIAGVGVEQAEPRKAPADAFAGESEAVPVLDVGGMNDEHQRQADRVGDKVPLAPGDLLAGVEPLDAARFRRLDALAVDDRGGR